MIRLPAVVAAAVMIPSIAWTADERVVTKRSPHSVATTLDRLTEVLTARGIGVAARVDHAAAAQKIAQSLKPTHILDLRKSQAGHAVDAIEPQDRSRSADEGVGVGG